MSILESGADAPAAWLHPAVFGPFGVGHNLRR
jgi:hypothetical protein